MNTRRVGSILPWCFTHCARRRATSGRSRSAAISVFFCAQPFGVHERPHRAVVDLQTAIPEFGHQPAQGEVALPAPLQQPLPPSADQLLRPVPAHLAGATLPVSRNRATQAIAVLSPTPKRAAALS